MNRSDRPVISRRRFMQSSAGMAAAAAMGRTASAQTPPELTMWWWGEQELPGLQAYVDDSVKIYTAATVTFWLR